MERAYIFYIGIILWSSIECHVTRHVEVTTDEAVLERLLISDVTTKSDENVNNHETTGAVIDTAFQKNIDNESPEISEKNSNGNSKSSSVSPQIYNENKNEEEKYISKQKSSENVYNPMKSVYLEDVIYSLKNQNWTVEEQPCLNATLHLLRSLQNFTLWAVWDWDSISSQPQGILFGDRFELGNFDECMNAPWADTHPELRTQYCLADIVLERTDKPVRRQVDLPAEPYGSAVDFVMRNKSAIYRALNLLTWGGCVPVSCDPRAVEHLMATLLARSHLGLAGMRARISVTEPCQRHDQPRAFDGLFYSFVIFVGVLVATSLVCTYLNCNRKQGPMSIKDGVIQSFCIRENLRNLMHMKKEGAEVLYGIRFLTICFIVMDHQIGIFNAGPVSNALEVDQYTLSVSAMFVLHDDLFVDTFFVLSGFLVGVAFMKLRNKSFFSPILFIIKRYLRLSVALAMVIFFYAAVFPYIGSGPLWDRAIALESDTCRKNWWLNLLMLSNYIDNENMCIVVSWYIPCDFHHFIVVVLMFWLYKHQPRLAMTCAGVLTIASLIAPGVINYLNELPAVQLFTYEFLKNPRTNEQFHIEYIKSHLRFTAYAIGLFTGFLFSYCKDSGNLKRISKKRSIYGAVAGLVIMTAVMMVGATYLWRNYHPVEGAIYAALNRPIWAGGVALVILCCCLGRVPYVEGFLSWYPWVPLSRLAYGLYLTHTALITRNVFVTRSPQLNEIISLLTSSVGVIVLGCAAALALWIFAEAPLNNLFVLCVTSKIKKVVPLEDLQTAVQEKPALSVASGSKASSSTSITSGNLQANLPTTIEISSKM